MQILVPQAKVPDATRDWDPCKMLRHGEATLTRLMDEEAKTGTSGTAVTGTAFTGTSWAAWNSFHRNFWDHDDR